MFCELMGICFSCRRTGNNRLNNRISESISASVTPLHVCVEEPRGPELGLCDSLALTSKVERNHRSRERREEAATEETGAELLQTESSELKQNQSMTSTIRNISMANTIRGVVSKRRIRFTEDGFNLDLTYIKENLIAMGFPAEKLEGCYRNHIDEVIRFLETKHKDHYRIYNLCSEKSYEAKKFHNRVGVYAFDDHHPPPIELIKPFCDDVQNWLLDHSKNIAAIHCKAGKGRTGVMVCCYLLHSRQYHTASDALNYYGSRRTSDNKGVTIPSQKRYVNYYASLVRDNFNYEAVTLYLREIRLDPPPVLNGGQGCYRFVISEHKNKIFTSEVYEIKKGCPSLSITLENNVRLRGDIKVEFYSTSMVKRKEKLFHFWFNTFFVHDYLESENNGAPTERTARALSCDGTAMDFQPILATKPRTGSLANIGSTPQTLVLTIEKKDIDKAHKDKHNKTFSPDFKISLFMHRSDSPVVPTNVPQTMGRAEEKIRIGTAGQESNDESSDGGESTNDESTGEEDGWESGESSTEVKETLSNTRDNSHNTHSNAQHVASPGEAVESPPRKNNVKRGDKKPCSTGNIKQTSKNSRSTTNR